MCLWDEEGAMKSDQGRVVVVIERNVNPIRKENLSLRNGANLSLRKGVNLRKLKREDIKHLILIHSF